MDNIQSLIKALESLGLNEKEAKIYLALSEIGSGTAYAVAEKAGLKKPTTYVILGELLKKGLVLKSPHSKTQLFTAKPAQELFEQMETNLKQASLSLPRILALNKKPKLQTLYFSGVDGLEQSLNYKISELTDAEMRGFHATAENVDDKILSIYHKYNNKLKSQGTRIQSFVPEHASLAEFRKTDKEYNREMKVLPYHLYSAKHSIEICDTFVRVVMHTTPESIIIDNADFAQEMRQIFELLWSKMDGKK